MSFTQYHAVSDPLWLFDIDTLKTATDAPQSCVLNKFPDILYINSRAQATTVATSHWHCRTPEIRYPQWSDLPAPHSPYHINRSWRDVGFNQVIIYPRNCIPKVVRRISVSHHIARRCLYVGHPARCGLRVLSDLLMTICSTFVFLHSSYSNSQESYPFNSFCSAFEFCRPWCQQTNLQITS